MTVLSADDCETMVDVRAGVDAIDRELVALLARRQRYMDAAARIKTDRSRVRDVARVEQVVANVKAEAVKAGLSEEIAETVWRSLIEASIQYELRRWDQMRER